MGAELIGPLLAGDACTQICDPDGHILDVNPDGSINFSGSITIGSEIEITNDDGNPIPVSAATLPLPSGAATETALPSILTELAQKLEAGQEVALNAATLSALETINSVVSGTVAISNFPTATEISNDVGNPVPISGTVTADLGTIDGVATEVTLALVLTELAQKLEAGQAVALDASTLAALETINATVSGTVVVSNAFALEATLQGVLTELQQKLEAGQEVALSAATLSALETISAVVSGTVSVSNFPASVEISNDAGNPIPVSGTVTATLGEIEIKNDAGNPVPISAASLPLPSGASTETTLSSVLAQLNDAGTDTVLSVLQALLTELGQKLESGQTVALDAATLAALESVTVAVSNFPSSTEISNDSGNPIPISGTVTANLGTINGAATETTLAALLTELGQKLEAGGTVALDAPTLAALETISATVSGTVAVSNAFALEATLQLILTELGQKLEVGQEVALSVATLAALETINASVTGTVAVSNFPATQPVSGPLTDTQLRATAVPVSGTVTANLGTIDGAATEVTLASILTELGQKLETGGAVALDAATLAALESITTTISGVVAVDIEALPSVAFAQIDVGVTQVAMPTTALAGRKAISIKALADNGAKIYVGETGLTASTASWELSAGDSIDLDLDDSVALFAISDSGTQRVSACEVA